MMAPAPLAGVAHVLAASRQPHLEQLRVEHGPHSSPTPKAWPRSMNSCVVGTHLEQPQVEHGPQSSRMPHSWLKFMNMCRPPPSSTHTHTHLEQLRIEHGPHDDLLHQLLGRPQPCDVVPARGVAAAVKDLVAHLCASGLGGVMHACWLSNSMAGICRCAACGAAEAAA